jgi:hypothetical protein
MATPTASPLRFSLASVRTADAVRISGILLHSVRAQCKSLGICEGSLVRCRAAGRATLVLDTADGRTVPVDRDMARFIQVCRADSVAAAERAQ